MKSLLLIPLFLLISTSFKTNEPELLGTIEFYLTSDNQVVLYYHGIYPYCYMKYAVDLMFIECDTMENMKHGFDTTFQDLHTIPLETIFPNDTSKIQIIRM